MADGIRRAHARVPCDREVEVYYGVATGGRAGTGRILNISLAGAYLAFPETLRRGQPYRLKVEGAGDLPCRVVREGPRDSPRAPGMRHYGMVFNLTADQERALREFIDRLRRQPATDKETRLDKSLRNYWG